MKIFGASLSIVILILVSGCQKDRNETSCWSILESVKSNREVGNLDLAFKGISELSRCLESVNAAKGMRYYYHLGWIYYDSGEYENAIESYDLGLKYQPDYSFAFWKRGQAYEALGNIDQSIADYKKAVRIGQATLPNFNKILEEYPDVKANLEPYVE